MPRTAQIPNIEFRLLIHRVYDEVQKKHAIRFSLETTKQFSNFNYRIDVDDRIEGKKILWNLHGLRAPLLSMPSHGAAQCTREYEGLKGKILFGLVKRDGEEITVGVSILKSAISVEQEGHPSLKVYTSIEEFEQNRTADQEQPRQKPDKHRITTIRKNITT